MDECTVTNWELSRTNPQLRFIPRLIELLGYAPSVDDGQTLGERIVEYRKTIGLSQRAFAERLGIDPSTLGRWERNERKPSSALMQGLASALKVVLTGDGLHS